MQWVAFVAEISFVPLISPSSRLKSSRAGKMNVLGCRILSATRPFIPRPTLHLRLASSASAPPSHTPPRPPQKHRPKKLKAKPPLSSTNPTASHILQSTIPSLPPLGLRSKSATDDEGQTEPIADGKVVALTTAESYDFPALLKGLDELGLLETAMNLVGEAIYLPRWHSPDSPSSAGEVFVFASGTIVTWGLEPQGAQAFLRTVVRGRAVRPGSELGFVEMGRYGELESEVLNYRVDPT
jgi:uncharacterized Rmd1/YagE family protein